MNKKLVIAFSIVVLGIGCFLLFKTSQKYTENKTTALKKQSLPDFELYDQKLKIFSAGLLKPNIPVCIFYYNAECEHCQYEATQLSKNATLFKDVQVLMVSVNTPAEAKVFAATYQLNKYPFITWLYDKDYSFYKWFGNTPTPSVFIYSAGHTLLKQYKGEVKISAVVKYLNDGKKG